MASLTTFLRTLFRRAPPSRPDATSPLVPRGNARLLDDTDGAVQRLPLRDAVVNVTAHTLGTVPCRTFVTDGLPVDLALTVRRDRSVDIEAWLGFLDASTDDARVLAPYALLEVPSEHGLLGQGRFRHALLVRPFELPVADTSRALAVLLLDDEEAHAARRMGPTRLIARLGLQNSWFPTTPWADPQRPSVVDLQAVHEDPSTSLPTLFIPSASVTRTADDAVLLQLPATLRETLDQHGLTTAPQLRVLTGTHPSAAAVQVHCDGRPPRALAASPDVRHFALNGLILSIEDHDVLVFTDDHAALLVTPATAAAFWEATRHGGLVVVGGARVSVSPPGTEVFLPTAPTGVVRSIAFVRPSPLDADVDADSLAAVVDAIASVLDNADLSGVGRLHVQLGSRTPSRYRISGPIHAPPGVLEATLQMLWTLNVPPAAGALRLDLELDFGA